MNRERNIQQARRALESAAREFDLCAAVVRQMIDKTPRLAGATRATLQAVCDRLEMAAAGIGVELRDMQTGPARSWLQIGAHCAAVVITVVGVGALEEVGSKAVNELLDRAGQVETVVADANEQLDQVETHAWRLLPGDQVEVNIETAAVRNHNEEVHDLEPEAREILVELAHSDHWSVTLSNAAWRRLEHTIDELTSWLEYRGTSHTITVEVQDAGGMEMVTLGWRRKA